MENAKKNLVFHFGVGCQASFLKIGYVKVRKRPLKPMVGRFHVPMDLGHPGTLNIQHSTDVKAGDALICFMYGVKEYHKKGCRGSPAYATLINRLPSYVILCKFK